MRKTLKICIRRANVTGSETASVFEQRDADYYEHIAAVPTAYRVKSSVFVPGIRTTLTGTRLIATAITTE